MEISAVIVAKDEEENITDCVKSLAFCNEVVLINDNSIDKTAKIAEKMQVKVFNHELNQDMASQLNFGIAKATNDWVLFVDADERISAELKNEIAKSLAAGRADQNGVSAFALKRVDFIWGRWLKYGEVGAFRSLRLVRKSRGKWQRRVHQYFATDGEIVNLQNPILHYPHKTLRKFLININAWSSLHAQANWEEGKKSTLFKVIFYPVAHFINNFVFRLGFLDGMQGFVFALVMAFHSFLGWAKLWLLQKGFSKI